VFNDKPLGNDGETLNVSDPRAFAIVTGVNAVIAN
jgi:hypothetical protein